MNFAKSVATRNGLAVKRGVAETPVSSCQSSPAIVRTNRGYRLRNHFTQADPITLVNLFPPTRLHHPTVLVRRHPFPSAGSSTKATQAKTPSG